MAYPVEWQKNEKNQNCLLFERTGFRVRGSGTQLVNDMKVTNLAVSCCSGGSMSRFDATNRRFGDDPWTLPLIERHYSTAQWTAVPVVGPIARSESVSPDLRLRFIHFHPRKI